MAIEMVRSCLWQIPGSPKLSGMWVQMNTETSGAARNERNVFLSVWIYPDQFVNAELKLTLVDDNWRSGDVEIWLPGIQDVGPWNFHCEVEGGYLKIIKK